MSEYDDASFTAYVKAEIAKRDAVIEDRDAEIERLKREIAELKKQKGISGVTDGLTANDRTGTWVDVTGKHLCAKCLLKDEKRVPLKNEKHGWRCMVCAKYYGDPDRPEGPIEYGDSSWMA